MTEAQAWEKFQQLPPNSREAVAKFIDFLLQDAKRLEEIEIKQPRSGFGSWKGIKMSDDFDTPMEDFKSYME